MINVFFSDIILFPAFGDTISDWGKDHFADQLDHGSCQRTYDALCHRPSEKVVGDDQREDHVVNKLSDKRGHI